MRYIKPVTKYKYYLKGNEVEYKTLLNYIEMKELKRIKEHAIKNKRFKIDYDFGSVIVEYFPDGFIKKEV